MDGSGTLELLYNRRRSSIIHKDFKHDRKHGVFVTSQGGSQCFNDVWVMISDLSGFTKTTKKYGVTHFTGIILRQHQIVMSLIDYFDPIAFSHEADNWTVLFNNGQTAVEAALAIRTVLGRQNKLQTEKGFPEYSVKFGGIGISKGDVWTNVGHPEFFGNPVSHAFVIGEDLAEKVVGLTYEAWEEMREKNPLAEFKRHDDDGIAWYEVVNWNKNNPINIGETFKIPKVTAHLQDGRFLMFTALFEGDREEREQKKKKIEERFMGDDCVCLMFSLCWGEMFATCSAPYVLNLRCHVNAVIGSITTNLHGLWNVTADGGFCIFSGADVARNVYDALRTCFDIKDCIAKMTKEKKVDLKTSGFGIHVGKLLLLPHSYISFGDPINVASKLGEDSLGSGEIGMTNECFEVLQSRGMPTSEWEPRTYKVSGVKLECHVYKE